MSEARDKRTDVLNTAKRIVSGKEGRQRPFQLVDVVSVLFNFIR